jgi:hypothetical protein
VATSPAGRQPRFVYLCDGQRGSAPPGRYGWRLVAANHRPLGRGRIASESLADCVAEAERLHRECADLQPVISTQDGLWTWRVALGADPLAVCVHPYLRRVECVRGLTQFFAAARTADPADGVVRHFGPHSLRGYLVEATPSEAAL